nr:hypothetical protein CJLB15_00072 [Campylobacter phage CJLB-15]
MSLIQFYVNQRQLSNVINVFRTYVFCLIQRRLVCPHHIDNIWIVRMFIIYHIPISLYR